MPYLRNPFTIFVVLQVLDFATTLFALAIGGSESNPLIQYFLALGPVPGLAIAKMLVLAVGLLGYLMGKHRGIRNANWAYSAIVLWNFTSIARLSMTSAA